MGCCFGHSNARLSLHDQTPAFPANRKSYRISRLRRHARIRLLPAVRRRSGALSLVHHPEDSSFCGRRRIPCRRPSSPGWQARGRALRRGRCFHRGDRHRGSRAARVAAAPAAGETARMRSRARLSALGVRSGRGAESRLARLGGMRRDRLDAAYIQHSRVDACRVRCLDCLDGISRSAGLTSGRSMIFLSLKIAALPLGRLFLRKTSIVRVLGVVALAALSAHAQTPGPFPARNVPATFFGTVVNDPYRALEDVKNPEVAAWAKSQADYARRQLESLPGYAEMRRRVAELDESAAAVIGFLRRDANGAIFFTRRRAQENTFKLYRRDRAGAEALLVDPDDWQKETGKPHAINYFAPSDDGRLLAFGISALGSEDASIHVIETATRKRVGQPIDRAQYPGISWRPDSRSFFYMRQQEMKPGMPATERYQRARAWLHVVGTPPGGDVLAAGPGVSPRMEVKPADLVWVIATPGSRFAVGLVAAGVRLDIALYSAPAETVGKPGTPWVRICDFPDKVTRFAVKDDGIYLLTYRDSPRFSVVRTGLAEPDIGKATTVVPASDRVLVSFEEAKDALYIEARDGAVKRLLRLGWGSASAVPVRLPLEGNAVLFPARPDVDGAMFGLSAWTRAREIHATDGSGEVTNTRLQALGPFDAPSDLVTTEVKVRSHDGALVPLSITRRTDVKLDGSNPTLLYGYGS